MDSRARNAAGSRTSPARAGWTGRLTKLADSGRVARLNPARAAALLPVLSILAACLTGQAQAQTDLPWSTTMTVGEGTEHTVLGVTAKTQGVQFRWL